MRHTLSCDQQKRHCGNFEGKMYSRFILPGFVRSTNRKKSTAGKEKSLDQRSISSSVKHSQCVVVPASFIMIAKTLEKKDNNWFVQSTAPSDLIVQVGDSKFHLHKLPMVSRSGYLSRMVFERSNAGRETSLKIQTDNLPGGAKAFELVVRFCYGWKVDLTPSNIAPLFSAAHFLEMSDDLELGNLIYKTESFLSFLIFSSWKETFRILKSCETISLWAKKLQIPKRCSESIALKACTNLKDTGSEENSVSCLPEKSKVEEEVESWWFEDVSSLRIDHFIEVIQSMKSKRMRPNLVGSCIAHWTTKWLSKITFELKTPPNLKNMTHQLRRVTTECLIRVLPTEENSVTCNFLLQLLKVGLVMQIDSVLLEALDQRIGCMLEQCRIPDLLVKNYEDDECVYDVGIVSRVVEAYVSLAPSNLGQKILAVGRLVDGYLTLVARDEKLKVKSFQSLAKVLPKDARYCDDNLYRATDTYLKAHPNITEEERTNLCKFLEYHRLSQEAREHVMKNNRLPLKIATRFILLERVKITRSKTKVESGFQRTKSTQAILRANSKSLEKGWIKSQKEIKKMTKEVESMKAQLNDLQMCKLKLLKQLKRCTVRRMFTFIRN